MVSTSNSISAAEPRDTLTSVSSSQVDDLCVKSLVRDLHRVKPVVYWLDLLLSSNIGWVCLAFAVVLRPFSFGMLVCSGVAIVALYRALCFIHEISHQNQRTLPGFETAWNLLAGFPLLMPSFIYCGVHNDHHKLSTYGTSNDPEYLPFAHSAGMTIMFAAESFAIPAILLVRFLLLALIGFMSSRFQRWLVTHASSLTINVRYCRKVTPELLKKVRRNSATIFVIWSVFLGLIILGVVPLRALAIWFLVVSCASFVNTMRTLGAHAYESSGEPLDRMGQLVDSIDTPGRYWTELWAPVGLRYHALHHYYPGIPYHSLPEAYRRLTRTPSLGDDYKMMSSPSLPHSLSSLLRKGLHREPRN